MKKERLLELAGVEQLDESAVSDTASQKMFSKYKKDIMRDISKFVEEKYDATIDWNNKDHAESFFDELFATVSGRIDNLMNAADSDGMVGEMLDNMDMGKK